MFFKFSTKFRKKNIIFSADLSHIARQASAPRSNTNKNKQAWCISGADPNDTRICRTPSRVRDIICPHLLPEYQAASTQSLPSCLE